MTRFAYVTGDAQAMSLRKVSVSATIILTLLLVGLADNRKPMLRRVFTAR